MRQAGTRKQMIEKYKEPQLNVRNKYMPITVAKIPKKGGFWGSNGF
jgi:hypothetical protein